MLRQPVRNASLMRDLSWEKRGVQSGAALPYLLTEVSLKLLRLPRSSRRKHTHAPSPRSASLREQKEDRQLLPYPLSQTLHNTCENMQRFMQKEFEKNSNRARRIQPRNVRAAASFLDAKLPSRVTPEMPHCRPAVGSGEVLVLYTLGLPRNNPAPRCFKL